MEDNPTWSNLPLRAGPIPAASVPATTISRSSRLSNRVPAPGRSAVTTPGATGTLTVPDILFCRAEGAGAWIGGDAS